MTQRLKKEVKNYADVIMTQRLIKRWKSWSKTSYRTVFLGKWIPQMRNRINIPKNMFSTKRIAKELFQSKRRTEGNILTNNTLSFCIKGSFFNSDNALGYDLVFREEKVKVEISDNALGFDLVFREEKVKVEISRAFISNIILNSGCAWSVYWRLLSSFYLWTFFNRRNFFKGKMRSSMVDGRRW